MHNGYSLDTCDICGKQLRIGHKFNLCATHLKEQQDKERIEHWLVTGDTGYSVGSTIRGCIRNYILESQNNCCAICGQSSIWNNKPLQFVLDHIDGNASNGFRDNLRLICPNCDSQLETFKSRNATSARRIKTKDNRKKKINQINLDTLEVIHTYNSVAEAGRTINCRPGNISNCLSGRSSSCSGFGWSYFENDI